MKTIKAQWQEQEAHVSSMSLDLQDDQGTET
jgi:hypothetical protein